MPEIFYSKKHYKCDQNALLTFEQVLLSQTYFDSTLKSEKISMILENDSIIDTFVVVISLICIIVGSRIHARIEKQNLTQNILNISWVFMYTLPEFRGKGVNGAIIKHLITWV
jgi:GNAT superfamily N-acetyltransferase